MYTGREYNKYTKLYYNRARYYSPELGRFISRDPIDISDDVNLYSYVGNNPVGFVDLMGLEKLLIILGIDKSGIDPTFNEYGYANNYNEFVGGMFNTLKKDLDLTNVEYDIKIVHNFEEFDNAINEKIREEIYFIGHGSINNITINSDKNIKDKGNQLYINSSNLKNDYQDNDLSNTILTLYSCNTGNDSINPLLSDPIGQKIQDHYGFEKTNAPNTFIWSNGNIYNGYNPINYISKSLNGEVIINGKMNLFK